MADIVQKLSRERLLQLVRAELPFNAVTGEELQGENLVRLQRSMKSMGWNDPRFVTLEQAKSNGWSVNPNTTVEVVVRDPDSGSINTVTLHNAASISGMPTLEAMLAMSQSELTRLNEQGLSNQGEDDDIVISPVRKSAEGQPGSTQSIDVLADQSIPSNSVEQVNTPSPSIDGSEVTNGYAVLAPYWRDGLHNIKGLSLADELNRTIKISNMANDKEAIEQLLAAHSCATKLGLQVVTYEHYRDDPHLKANAAQPCTLLGGVFFRDQEGGYRPASGGKPVLLDKGDSVLLKSKDAESYRAAMELALAKGWTAIELKGKPTMLSEAWLEAKLKGLDVVNYAPNEKDLARYAERLAQESALKMQSQNNDTEQCPEMVEVRPFVDEKLNREFAEAVAETNEGEKVKASLSAVSKGTYVGPIVAVEDYRIGQKTGRDASQITWHDITKLKGRSLAKGDIAEISYFDGIGEVKDEPANLREMVSTGRGIAR